MKFQSYEKHSERILIFAVLALSIFAGIVADRVNSNLQVISDSAEVTLTDPEDGIKDFYGSLYQSMWDAKSYRKNGSSPQIRTSTDKLDGILLEGLDVLVSRRGLPTIRVRTNSKGLRDESFNNTPPENTTRILVIGDSYTYGTGVNESDRYTEVLEKKLNENSEKDYQVINAGIFGAGAEDYYKFLKYRGLSYNPDILIIGVVGNDWMPLEEQKKITRKAGKQISSKYTNLSASRKRELLSERIHELHVKNNDLEGYSVLSNLTSLSSENNIETIMFVASSMNDKEKLETVKKYGRTNNATFLKAPKELRDDRQSRFCLRYSPNRVSTLDPHPSPIGHEMMAEKLYRNISGKGEPLAPWHYGGIFQWFDPC